MNCLEQILRPIDYSGLDVQIEKFRRLAEEYKQNNVAYYGEYLSSILFGEDDVNGDAKRLPDHKISNT